MKRMPLDKALHITRNPYSFHKQDIRRANLACAEWAESYKDAYHNMRDWAKENGVDTTAYHGP